MAWLTPGSLRGKIIVGFSLLAGTVVVSLLITLVETSLIEEQIKAQNQSHSLLNAAYEMRRQEKNYILYSQRADLDHLQSAIREFSDVLEDSSTYEVLGPDVRALTELVGDYRRSVDLLTSPSAESDREATKTAVRGKGSEIIERARAASRMVEYRIAGKLSRLKIWLLASKGLLAALAVATALAIIHLIGRSLREFQSKMDQIATGTLRELPLTARDEEIASLEKACNRMLREISLRQVYLLQSEKLASVGTMLAGIAHELNNPLSNISASCQILLEEADRKGRVCGGSGAAVSLTGGPDGNSGMQRQDPPDELLVREMLLQIYGETERARITIRTLLNYSRTRPSEKSLFPLLPLVRETVVLFQGKLGKDVTVTVRIPDDVQVFGDRHRLQQVFVNLIKNALDSMEGPGAVAIEAAEGSPREDLEGERIWAPSSLLTAKPGHYVDIAVTDTGSGIPAAHLTRIFDPFFTTKDVGHGTGLGLFIVREIVDELGGGIMVRSEERKGTTFVLRLPTRWGAA